MKYLSSQKIITIRSVCVVCVCVCKGEGCVIQPSNLLVLPLTEVKSFCHFDSSAHNSNHTPLLVFGIHYQKNLACISARNISRNKYRRNIDNDAS